MDSSNEASIQMLLENLCKSIYKDFNTSNSKIAHHMQYSYGSPGRNICDSSKIIPEKLLKKCKLRSFEILLKKSQQKTPDEGYSVIINPFRELKFNRFEYNIYVGQIRPYFETYGQVEKKKMEKILRKCDLFSECIQFIEGNDYFRSEKSDGYSILWFLILLKNNSPMDVILEDGSNESYFSIHTNSVPKFPLFVSKRFLLDWHAGSVLDQNPYCRSMSRINYNFTALRQMEPTIESGVPVQQTQLYSIKAILDEIKTQRKSKTICFTNNKWEHLGKRYTFDEKCNHFATLFENFFCTESSMATLNLNSMACSRSNIVSEVRIVQMMEFVEHIKLLLIGIESESFLFNQPLIKFSIAECLTVENVTPETMDHFIADFIECGTCYKRLKAIVACNIDGYKLKNDGFLSKALHVCLDKYLEMFRRTVIMGKQNSIAEIFLRTSPLIRQIRALAKLLAIHPTDISDEVPRGSEFLGYLYRQIIGITQKDLSFLFVFILTECCAVYFKHFSSWIFNGIVEDPARELFIEFIDYYVPKTKFFFDKAFLIKRQSVPGFLQGWEESILLCGKYSNLLRQYNPTHQIFTIKPPRITVCLSFDQLKIVEMEFEKHRQLAQSVCGRPFDVTKMRKQQEQKRKKMVEVIALKFQENIKNWKIEQDLELAQIVKQREKDRSTLLQQIQENKERKFLERYENLEIERDYLRKQKQADLESLERENERRIKNIEYYTELASIVDSQRQRTEMEIEKLKKNVSRQKSKTDAKEDSVDDSDDESLYFDAERSPLPTFLPESLNTAANHVNIPTEDSLNANSKSDESILYRMINKANILTSQISLCGNEENRQDLLTSNQTNKLKVLQEKYGHLDANANSDQTSTVSELTDLQKNRNKVLSLEFGITDICVNLSSVEKCDHEFAKNKKLAQGHDFIFESAEDVNANRTKPKPLTDLESNRRKVLAQEFDLVQPTLTENQDETSTKNKLRSSLSLDLDSTKSNELMVKSCHSDFIVSPMSTTSDGLIACSEESDSESKNEDKTKLKLNCYISLSNQTEFLNSSAESADRESPLAAPKTGRKENKREEFSFQSKSQPIFSQLPRPTFTSKNIFDLSPHLSANDAEYNAILPSPIECPSNGLSVTNVKELNTANLTYFLQQSLIIPLQVQSSILNNEILKIFFEELEILSHFNSLKNYFFMMDGEFASNISDGILNKLHQIREPRELFNSHVLHSILENALQSSLMGNDKNAENLSFCIPNVPEKFEISSPNVLNELHLSYKVHWPVNLLISEEAIDQYDRVFQHLIKLRRITWLLENCFYKLKDIRKQSSDMIQKSSQFRHVQHIRHKLLCFIHALQNHITSIAIQGSWQMFQEDLATVKSMQDLYRKHTKYLKRVKFLCMLNKSSQEFFSKMEDAFVVILRFCHNLQSKDWHCDDFGTYTHPKYEKLQIIENDFMGLIKFIIYAGRKMSQCGYQTEISEFIYMINVNGYYDCV